MGRLSFSNKETAEKASIKFHNFHALRKQVDLNHQVWQGNF